MIKVICGPKGSGKTKRIIDAANEAVAGAKGNLVFITDTKRYMYDLRREIRFIDTSDYSVAGEDALCGFIKGVIAVSYDNEYVYVDGIARIAGKAIKDMAQFFYMMEKVSDMRSLTLYITCSCAEEELPEFAKKYL
ncbi:MAG TPA: hypothetical protein H9812_07290 [Candidatus Gallimonas intestinigallinarum]|uniref:Twitching motility protein PilT n=1 Tax=Candidatus Gallimonas intestinigallinarum TaxID=2838604 RepID=A0A9D2DYD7_9FIRM|nr:hypothetical protein [Candidatus Gallimonas intestinigallinarum]